MKQLGEVLLGVGALSTSAAGCAPPTEEFDPWPFRVDAVTLECKVGRVYVTAPDGSRYGVNGSARGNSAGTEPIQSHYDVQPVIDRGLELCRSGADRARLVRPAAAARRDPLAGSSRIEPEPSGVGGLALVTDESTAIGGQRPSLHASCSADGSPDMSIDTARPPSRPPPLRGVFMRLTIDGEPQRIEAAWALGSIWTTRELSEAAELRLVRALAEARAVQLEGLDGFAATPISWRVDLEDGERRRLLRQCKE